MRSVAVLLVLVVLATLVPASPAAAAPPTAPSGVTATVVNGRVVLRWNAATDPGGWIRTYEIERDGKWVGWTWGATRTWTDTTANPNGGHTWRIRAVDNNREWGPHSGAVRVGVAPPGGSATLLAAGDIGQCGGQQAGVASLIGARPGVLFAALGDISQSDGSAASLRDCYDPWFGSFRSRTRPVPGNHDYKAPGAGPYYDYFGALAGTRGRGWYAYDVGSWRVYALNGECWEAGVGGCATTDPQYRWLQADLAANPRQCIAAYWHRPLRSTAVNYREEFAMVDTYNLLQRAGADIVLFGHSHGYERWGRMDSAGRPTSSGIRNFTVGTGGASLREYGPWRTGLEARAAVYGVLELTLRSDGYSWNFLRSGGAQFSDSGSDRC